MTTANPNDTESLFESEALLVRQTPSLKTIWWHMRNGPVQCFSRVLLADLIKAFARVEEGDLNIQYVVLASATPGIFNFGGDLSLFADCVRNRDYQSLVEYGVACLKGITTMDQLPEKNAISIALVQGDALGGGFEAAMACQVVIAEKGVTMGLPETLFNLFPGMGAMPLIARKTSVKLAQELMLSGRTFTSDEAYEMGLVDVLAEPGEGELAVARYIEATRSRHTGRVGVFRARSATFPVTDSALLKVVELWAETAMKLTERDLKLMGRLVKAQSKRWTLPAGQKD